MQLYATELDPKRHGTTQQLIAWHCGVNPPEKSRARIQKFASLVHKHHFALPAAVLHKRRINNLAKSTRADIHVAHSVHLVHDAPHAAHRKHECAQLSGTCGAPFAQNHGVDTATRLGPTRTAHVDGTSQHLPAVGLNANTNRKLRSGTHFQPKPKRHAGDIAPQNGIGASNRRARNRGKLSKRQVMEQQM